MAQFKFANFKIRYKSFCMSLYGYQLLDLSKPYMEKLSVAWRKCVRQVLCLTSRTHNNLIPLIINDLDVISQLDKRTIKYIISLHSSENEYVKINLSLIKEGSGSGLGNTLKSQSNKYRFEKKCTTHVLKNVLHSLESRQLNVVPEILKLVANQVRELLNMRDIGNQVLTVGEIDQIIHFLCTS
jgi:hypothetical protein